jgi:hypothetical protein
LIFIANIHQIKLYKLKIIKIQFNFLFYSYSSLVSIGFGIEIRLSQHEIKVQLRMHSTVMESFFRFREKSYWTQQRNIWCMKKYSSNSIFCFIFYVLCVICKTIKKIEQNVSFYKLNLDMGWLPFIQKHCKKNSCSSCWTLWPINT